ncbi:MAG: TetR/AcrR family transcriptional regulator [Ardenticatenaceae bacterium]|nr:TetR/AcrR family transcriptional regulator [Ardenticatenaceae bacterium]
MNLHAGNSELTRRDELLVSAAHLFCEKGYHATSMEDIARTLGILRGSLYHHIRSKEDLLIEIMTRGIGYLLELVRPIATSAQPADEKLGAMIRAHVLAITSHPDVLTVFLHELKSVSPERLPEVLALRDEYEQLVRSVIAGGIDEGVFRPVDVPLATFGLLGLVNWLYQWYKPGGRRKPEEIADQFEDLALHALRNERDEWPVAGCR